MKFAKYLEENCISEWAAAYFDYKKGKKLIKRAEIQASTSTRRRGRNISPSTTPLVTRDSRQASNTYGSTINASHESASRTPTTIIDKTEGDPEEPHNLIRPKPAVTSDVLNSYSRNRPVKRHSSGLHQNITNNTLPEDFGIELVPDNEAQETFYAFVDEQIRKIDEFYIEREVEAGKRLGELRCQLKEMKDRKRVLSSRRLPVLAEERNGRSDYTRSLVANLRSFFSYADVDLLDRHPISDNPNGESPTQLLLTYRVARRRLRIAIQEFYHSLELLQSYRSLNRTALTKVLKKFDKTVKVKSSTQYLYAFDHKTNIGTSLFLDKIMRDSEDVYAKYYYSGDRKHAITALRTKVKTEDYRFTMLRIGAYAGLSISLGLEGLVRSQVNFVHDVERTYLLQVWGALFFLILISILFGLNCYIWTRNKINYVFIFEYNVRHNLNWIQYLEIPVFIAFLFSLLFWMCFSNFFPAFTRWYPLLFVACTTSIIFLPVRAVHLSTRKWFINAHARLLVSGLSSVRFQDVFLGDLYNSLTYSVGNIALFFCVYRYDWHNPAQCGSGHSILLGFFTTLPGILRLLQCFRRYYDTRHYFPHLINALKYSMTILQYTTLSLWRIHGFERFKILYILFATLNSLYTATWDIVMDASLLQPGSKPMFLRTHRAYSSTWVYYAFLILDPILRFSWVFYIIYSHDILNAAALSFYIGLAECFRRSVWSTFRVENEHIANVLMYRATRELPLPYAIHTAADLEGQQRKSGDTSKTRNERPRVAEAHATDFERKALDTLHMDDVNVDSEEGSDEEPPSAGHSPPDTENED